MLRGTSCLVVASLIAGCAGPFSDAEMTRLSQFELGSLPTSATNRFADDPAAARLGRDFFFDTRFSGPLTHDSDLGSAGTTERVACATCHDPARGGVDARGTNVSVAAAFADRNTPSVLNAAYAPWMLWDGRKDSLWSQALGPIESEAEHNFSRLEVVHRIASVPGYRADYEAIFGALPDWLDDPVRCPPRGKPGMPAFDAMTPADRESVNQIFASFGKAIEAYERQLFDRSSAFDRFLEGDESALSFAAQRGARLFVGRAACDECHSGGNLSDGQFHNTGVVQEGAHIPPADLGRAGGIASVQADEFNAAGPYSDAARSVNVEARAAEALGAFKTPGLRGVGRTAPYMHTGAFRTLEEVVIFYRDGGHLTGFSGTKDPAMRALSLTSQDVEDLVAFLNALDGVPPPFELASPPVPR